MHNIEGTCIHVNMLTFDQYTIKWISSRGADYVHLSLFKFIRFLSVLDSDLLTDGVFQIIQNQSFIVFFKGLP